MWKLRSLNTKIAPVTCREFDVISQKILLAGSILEANNLARFKRKLSIKVKWVLLAWIKYVRAFKSHLLFRSGRSVPPYHAILPN